MEWDWTIFDAIDAQTADELVSLSERKKKLKKLKRKLNEFNPKDAEPLKAIFACEDYEQRNAMIKVQWENARAEMDKQYEIQKQYSTKTIEYQSAHARYDELEQIQYFLTDCYDI